MRSLVLVGLLGCADADAPRARPVDPAAPVQVVLTPARGAPEARVTVELAVTPQTIQRGLMHRTELAPDRGMLFVMDRDKDWAFWMRDTLISLDMIFITRDLTVAGIVPRTTPRTDRPRRVGAPSRYVLEVNAGWAAAHHLAPGDRVRFDNLSL